jgi:hypothetical protein
MEDERTPPGYEFTGPDEQGFIRLQMPNLDPNHAGQFYCLTLGCDRDAIAEAMCQWLSIIDYGECH